jgi:hypothetical protein
VKATAYLCFSASLAGMMAPSSLVSAQELGHIINDGEPAGVPSRKMSDAAKGRYVTNAYAACLLKRKSTLVLRALQLPPARSGEAFARIATSDCLSNGNLRMPNSLLRGGAFLALYKRDFRSAPPPPRLGSVDYTQDSLTTDPNDPEVAVRIFARCVLKANPTGVRTLILSPVATDAENQAFAALTPVFSDCVSGKPIRFSKAALQAVFAEVAYREGNPSFSNAKTARIR